MATFLLELFSEEIPSRMQQNAASQLSQLLFKQFQLALNTPADPMGSRNITPKLFVSPRHLAISITGLPLIQPDYAEERRGPKIGAPEQALKGFLTATGLTIDQCEQRDGYYYANIERKGRSMADVAKELVEYALVNFNWPKSMHWGSRDARPLAWVRPLHNIVALLDEQIIPAQFGHLTASNITHGHRFLAPAEIKIPHAEQYESLMLAANVMVDFAARREKIAAEIAALATAAKLQLVEDENLLNEVTGLVEWPVPLLCQFDAKFLDLPPEVLISEMKNHQRYFALTDAAGKLTNQFITVANMVNADGGARVKDGNARVVRARLADGEFYWEQDRKVSLEDWGKKLSDVVFHAKVGMMDAKVARIEALALAIYKSIYRQDLPLGEENVRLAAKLCKADLTSGMVGEFPELQGIMGRYYAENENIPPVIADAIRDHYKPVGAADVLPESLLARIISIADKIDSIASLFAAGEKPTGSKDPLALRRAALGVLRIITDSNSQQKNEEVYALSQLDLGAHVLKALEQLPSVDQASIKTLHQEIMLFFEDRLRMVLKDKGFNHSIVEASLSIHGAGLPLMSEAASYHVADFLSREAGKKFLSAAKRVLSMLAAEEKKNAKTYEPISDIQKTILSEPAERDLVSAVGGVRGALAFHTIQPHISYLSLLTDKVQRFFDETLINASDAEVRNARLALLALIRKNMNLIADFSKIEG